MDDRRTSNGGIEADPEQAAHAQQTFAADNPVSGPRWGHVGVFLGLTFGLTWLLNLAMYLRGGIDRPGAVTVLQFQMLLPAFSAILLGLRWFPESPLYYRRAAGRPRWFYYYFLLMTVVFGLGALGVSLAPDQGPVTILAATAPLALAFIGLILLIVLRIISGPEAMARVWLAGGNWRAWVVFGLGFVAYYVLQVALNGVFGLGQAQLSAPAGLPPGMTLQVFVAAAAVQSVLLAPLLAIVITFGEEYGWRGYLQTELFKLGRRRGVLLLGVIWGAWHWPIILMGYNYPGHPLLGVVLMTLYTTGLGVVLGYAVLRSGSVLLASYLHGLNNQVLAYLFAIGFRPFDAAYAFGIGTYGVVTLAIVAALILIDPIWRGSGGTLVEPQVEGATSSSLTR
jgi:membrane protease YdiL (CAAX protease family)